MDKQLAEFTFKVTLRNGEHLDEKVIEPTFASAWIAIAFRHGMLAKTIVLDNFKLLMEADT